MKRKKEGRGEERGCSSYKYLGLRESTLLCLPPAI
jgi:hypothetical protein